MPRAAHAHASRRLQRRPEGPRQDGLPAGRFGGLVGTIDHLTPSPHDPRDLERDPNRNHIYIWIDVPAGRHAGKYECAFNTESNQPDSTTQFYVVEEEISAADFPTVGFSSAEVSYSGLGLTQADFTDVTNGQLRSSVVSWAQDDAIVCAYGVVYQEGDGLDKVHMNSGEPAGSTHADRKNEDGALVFYYRNPGGNPFRRWVFIKFSTQQLG